MPMTPHAHTLTCSHEYIDTNPHSHALSITLSRTGTHTRLHNTRTHTHTHKMRRHAHTHTHTHTRRQAGSHAHMHKRTHARTHARAHAQQDAGDEGGRGRVGIHTASAVCTVWSSSNVILTPLPIVSSCITHHRQQLINSTYTRVYECFISANMCICACIFCCGQKKSFVHAEHKRKHPLCTHVRKWMIPSHLVWFLVAIGTPRRSDRSTMPTVISDF